LAYTARPFSAATAEKMGLVSKVIEGGRDAVIKSALQLAADIARKSPLAVAGTKHLITHARDHSCDLLISARAGH
jgi:delta(3,5)-delta(2,4)-dienoyl-CoA isomerase